MLKGHTKIELTNVKTGEKKTYEKDNFVTNLFRDAMQPCGAYGSLAEYFMKNSRKAQEAFLEMTRGIAMFDSALPNDPDQYTLPAGVNMIGRGIDTAYNGSDPTMGSYSVSESVIDNDGTGVGYRFVWDFTTKQANGIIKSICLCPTTSAKIGFGAPTALTDNTEDFWCKYLNDLGGNTARFPGTTDDQYSLQIVWRDIENARMLKVTDGFSNPPTQTHSMFFDKKITISEYPIQTTKASILDSYNGSEREKMTPTKQYLVEMPQELQALCTDTSIQRGYDARIDEENKTLNISLLLGRNCTISAGGTIYIWKVNLETMASTVETYTNNTGYQIGGYSANRSYHCIYEMQNYILAFVYVSNDDTRMYCISKTTGECKRVTWMNGTDIVFNSSSDRYKFDYFLRNKDLFIARPYSMTGTNNYGMMIDCVTGTAKHLGLTNCFRTEQAYNFPVGNKKYMIIHNYGAYLYPFVFFTINNLDTPIEKTDEQAMKITYELTKE